MVEAGSRGILVLTLVAAGVLLIANVADAQMTLRQMLPQMAATNKPHFVMFHIPRWVKKIRVTVYDLVYMCVIGLHFLYGWLIIIIVFLFEKKKIKV